MNRLSRERSPQSVFFWSDVFGEEAIFYSDFGQTFQYKDDPSTAPQLQATASSSSVVSAPPKKEVKSISFPSLQEVLAKSWKDIPKRFFPLSPTFVKHRVLTKFRSDPLRSHSHLVTLDDCLQRPIQTTSQQLRRLSFARSTHSV